MDIEYYDQELKQWVKLPNSNTYNLDIPPQRKFSFLKSLNRFATENKQGIAIFIGLLNVVTTTMSFIVLTHRTKNIVKEQIKNTKKIINGDKKANSDIDSKKAKDIITDMKILNVELKKEYPLEQLDLFYNPLSDSLEIAMIKILKNKQKKGFGTKVMKEIIDFANENNLTLVLTPVTRSGKPQKHLVKFYKSLGFIENKGKQEDSRFTHTLIKKPEIPIVSYLSRINKEVFS